MDLDPGRGIIAPAWQRPGASICSRQSGSARKLSAEQMTPHDYLSEHGLAMLLLCSSLGLKEKSGTGTATPLTLSEWNNLEPRIAESTFASTSALLGQAAGELQHGLDLLPDEAKRLRHLLERGSRLTLELESLFSQGMWAVTRLDSKYPAKLRDTLKHQAPTVLFGAGAI